MLSNFYGKFDSVILATGFRPDLRSLLPDATGVLDDYGKPLATGQVTDEPCIYFCGYIASSTGQLREIGLEAKRIAEIAKSYLAIGRSAASLTTVGHRNL
jgi:hypothetical protein